MPPKPLSAKPTAGRVHGGGIARLAIPKEPSSESDEAGWYTQVQTPLGEVSFEPLRVGLSGVGIPRVLEDTGHKPRDLADDYRSLNKTGLVFHEVIVCCEDLNDTLR